MLWVILVQGFDLSKWKPYEFKEKEYFKYELNSTEEGEEKKGLYEIEIDGNTVKINGSYDGMEGSINFKAKSKKQIPGMLMAQMFFNPWLAPLGITLFSQTFISAFLMYGNMEYRSSEGSVEIISGKESCSYGGESGSLFQVKQNGRVVYELCISENVGLPLYMKSVSDKGDAYEIKLLEHR